MLIVQYLNRVDLIVAVIIVAARSRFRRCVSGWRRSGSTGGSRSRRRQTEDGRADGGAQLLLFRDELLGIDCLWLGTILINVAAVLTAASMLYYLRKALSLRFGPGLTYNSTIVTRE